MPPTNWADLFAKAQRSAVHLEMRDHYAAPSEDDPIACWEATGVADADPGSEWWAGWSRIVRDAVARGVQVRRARIVSEPVTRYTRWLHAITPANLAAGERVRWLPRAHAVDLALPGSDFWVFDDTLVRFGQFSGDGVPLEPQYRDEPEVVKLCLDAFESVWSRGVPHEEYEIR
ncbi:DUF6879 family protein [Streptacidiphilus anmyonensis]|uniref:DUF6879 family protein n=1 Tax=Streptacidiphilus anmyonensis TaxID=405782 RepID=UPI0005A5FB8E|nr:DUF6879 family protein [Streptacidiphilus anmyonensis]